MTSDDLTPKGSLFQQNPGGQMIWGTDPTQIFFKRIETTN